MTQIRCATKHAGFTLVELLVAFSVLILLLVMLLSATNQTISTVRTASARVDAFQAARTAFDVISQKVAQATMNTYWDYYDASNTPRITGSSGNSATFVPARYGRRSDLNFLIQSGSGQGGSYGQELFFAAPEALSVDSSRDQTQGLLNAIGYFIQFGNDDAYRPKVVSQQRYRYRLMQSIQPTENFAIFNSASNTWTAAVKSSAWPVAENIIALIVWPRLSQLEDPAGTGISTNYLYNSRMALPASSTLPFPIQYAQAPPTVQLTMVVIDETSALRLANASGSSEPSVISNALAGKFTNVTNYQTDLDTLQSALTDKHLSFRVLNTTVSLRESKWSSR